MIKCWHYRKIISRSADENAPLPPDAQAHLAQCADCRQRHETEHEIASRLAAGAREQKLRPAPNFIHTRIMARIAETAPDARPAAGLFRWTAVVTVAAVVVTALLLWPVPPHSKPDVQPSPAPETVATLELPNPKILAQWATNPDQPLEAEVKAVVHDAQGAMTALADNFFPEKLRETLFNPPSAEN